MLKSILSTLFSGVQTKTIDNYVGGIDIVGSWVEFGLVGVAIVAGVFFALPVLMKAMENRKKKKPYLSGDYWNCHSRVHEILTELRVELDCARTQIVQFHNGGNFFDGNPMAKITMTHESLRNGISPESRNWKDLQLPLMFHLLEKTKENNTKLYINDEDDDSYSKQQLDAGNVLSYSVLPLYKAGNYFGFVMCQWCAWSKVDEISESKVNDKLQWARDGLQIELERENRRKN